MLEIVEKMIAGIGVLALVLVVTLYNWAPPSLRNPEDVPRVQKAPPVPTSGTSEAIAQPARPSLADRTILEKITREQGVRITNRRITRENYDVPAILFEEATKEANWMADFKKIGSRPIAAKDGRATRLQIFLDESTETYLHKFDFQNNDIIELIDGSTVDFRANSHELYELFGTLSKKMRRGEPLDITVNRGGRLVNLNFRLQ